MYCGCSLLRNVLVCFFRTLSYHRRWRQINGARDGSHFIKHDHDYYHNPQPMFITCTQYVEILLMCIVNKRTGASNCHQFFPFMKGSIQVRNHQQIGQTADTRYRLNIYLKEIFHHISYHLDEHIHFVISINFFRMFFKISDFLLELLNQLLVPRYEHKI